MKTTRKELYASLYKTIAPATCRHAGEFAREKVLRIAIDAIIDKHCAGQYVNVTKL